MRHWRGKESDFFWQRSMRNASEAKERFPKLKQSFSTVLLKERAVFQQGVLNKMGVLMLWRTRVHMDISLAMVHSSQHMQNFT